MDGDDHDHGRVMMMGWLVGLNQVLPKSLSPLCQAASSKLPSFRFPALPELQIPKIQSFCKNFRIWNDDDD